MLCRRAMASRVVAAWRWSKRSTARPERHRCRRRPRGRSGAQFQERSRPMGDDMIGRRKFIGGVAIGTAAALVYPSSRVLGANDRVRIGLIGAGGRGQELLKQVLKLANAQLVAVADVFKRRNEEAKQLAPGIKAFDDHRRLLEMKDVDAVIVATPLHIHARHFLDTLAAGKDLYAEKTMTWSIAEADECRSAARNSKQVIAVGLQHQSSGY